MTDLGKQVLGFMKNGSFFTAWDMYISLNKKFPMEDIVNEFEILLDTGIIKRDVATDSDFGGWFRRATIFEIADWKLC